jgi:uncharacterized membrane protein YcaP (DUF421 family)
LPEYVIILIRSLFSFVILLAMTRMMGRTQLSQLTFFDYVVGISIGSIAASMSVDQNVKIINGIIGIIVWGLLPIAIAYANLKSYRFRKVTDGSPTVLIENGNIIENNMRKMRISGDELMLMLRQKNAFKLADVEFAVLETNGMLSVQKKTSAQPVTPKMLKLKVKEESEMSIVVLDGVILEKSLVAKGYTKEWLLSELKKKGVKQVTDIFIAQLTMDGKLHLDYRKEE